MSEKHELKSRVHELEKTVKKLKESPQDEKTVTDIQNLQYQMNENIQSVETLKSSMKDANSHLKNELMKFHEILEKLAVVNTKEIETTIIELQETVNEQTDRIEKLVQENTELRERIVIIETAPCMKPKQFAAYTEFEELWQKVDELENKSGDDKDSALIAKMKEEIEDLKIAVKFLKKSKRDEQRDSDASSHEALAEAQNLKVQVQEINSKLVEVETNSKQEMLTQIQELQSKIEVFENNTIISKSESQFNSQFANKQEFEELWQKVEEIENKSGDDQDSAIIAKMKEDIEDLKISVNMLKKQKRKDMRDSDAAAAEYIAENQNLKSKIEELNTKITDLESNTQTKISTLESNTETKIKILETNSTNNITTISSQPSTGFASLQEFEELWQKVDELENKSGDDQNSPIIVKMKEDIEDLKISVRSMKNDNKKAKNQLSNVEKDVGKTNDSITLLQKSLNEQLAILQNTINQLQQNVTVIKSSDLNQVNQDINKLNQRFERLQSDKHEKPRDTSVILPQKLEDRLIHLEEAIKHGKSVNGRQSNSQVMVDIPTLANVQLIFRQQKGK